VSLLQQLIMAASACVQVQHAPVADVVHQPRADVALSPSFSANVLTFELPLTIDLLRGKQVGGRPLLAETPIAKATIKDGAVALTVPGQPPIDLSAACTPLDKPSRR
jgi:hypothetical protein